MCVLQRLEKQTDTVRCGMHVQVLVCMQTNQMTAPCRRFTVNDLRLFRSRLLSVYIYVRALWMDDDAEIWK